jgi:transmembrane sensor
MSSMQSPMGAAEIARAAQAVDWFQRVGAEDVSEQDLGEWIQWCSDSENLREFQQVRSTWAAFEQLRPEASVLLEALLSEQPVVSNVESRPAIRMSARSNWRWRQIGIAAGMGAMAIAGARYAYDTGLFVRSQQVFVARTADRSAVLPDGSQLTLAPKTNVAVNFSGNVRNLDLSHGQAYFKVRANKSKPFIVVAGKLKVTAVGTIFDVRSETNRVVVTVQEGVVEVTPTAEEHTLSPERWRVSAGNQLAYNENPRSAQIRAIDPDRSMAWREGRLEYFGEPLSAVVADINRYSDQSIEITDLQLAQLTFTGTLFTESIDDWLSAIQTTFPIRVVKGDDHRVLLMKR